MVRASGGLAANWTISRANIATASCSDDQERELADRTIRTVLQNPLRLATVTALIDALHA